MVSILDLEKEIKKLKTKLKSQDNRINNIENEVFGEIQLEQKKIETINESTEKLPPPVSQNNNNLRFILIVVYLLIMYFSFLYIIKSPIIPIILIIISIYGLFHLPKLDDVKTIKTNKHQNHNIPKPIEENEVEIKEKKNDFTSSKDIELLLGGNWLNKIGMIILILGIIFFFKYSIDKGWISEEFRVLIGICIGISFLFMGEYFEKKKYNIYARTFTGGGSLILYLSVFAATVFYEIISFTFAIMINTIITVITLGLALRYKSEIISYFGFIGVYLLPFTMGISKANDIYMLVYFTIINLGLFAFIFRNINKNIIYSFILGSYLIPILIGISLVNIYYTLIYYMILNILIAIITYKKDYAELLNSILIGGYIIPSIFFTFIKNFNVNLFLIFSFLNILIFSFIFYKKNWNELKTIAPTIIILILVPFLFIGKYSINTSYTFIFLSLIILCIFSYFKNSKNIFYFTFIWSIISPKIMLPINTIEFNLPYIIYLLIIIIGLLVMSHIKNWKYGELYSIFLVFPLLTPIISLNYLAESILILIIFFIIFLISQIYRIVNNPKLIEDFHVISIVSNGLLFSIIFYYYIIRKISTLNENFGIFLLIMSLLYFIISSIIYKNLKIKNIKDIDHYNNETKPVISLLGMGLTFLILFFPAQFSNELLTLSWMTFGLLLTWIGFKITHAKLRGIGVILYFIGLLKFIFIDFANLTTEIAFFSIRSLMFIFLIMITALIAYLYKLNNDDIREFEVLLLNTFNIILSLLIWSYITYETTIIFDGIKELLMITLIWAIYAVILMVSGFTLRNRNIRLYSLIIFGITILKLFLVDIWELERVYRIIAFIILGILLLASSFLYHRFIDFIKKK